MKKSILLLSSIMLILTGCNTPKDDDKGGDTPVTPTVVFDKNLIGLWYINSSSTGMVSINLPFTVNENETVDLGGQNFTLDGYYAEYTNVFQFSYGTYYFIIEYDATSDDVNYAFQHGEDYDFGYAARTQNETGTYDYIGEEYPMDKINTYLGTEGNVPSMSTDKYYLDLFNSSIYNAKCADIEIRNSSLDAFTTYLNSLLEEGYIFSNYTKDNGKSDVFYIGYDSSKTYTLRARYFSDGSESHIFVYKYNENIKS